MKINVKEIGCDFLAFSSHKMLGPTGIGVLYMKRELQEKLVPFLGGGDMIKTVDFEVSTWNLPPHKYEAGTPNMAGAVGLSAAIDYIKNIGIDLITNHSKKMSKLCREMIEENITDVKIFGTSEMGIVSFNIGKIHAHDIATFADREGIAIRAGHHCAQPLMKVLGQAATARASFYIYNYEEEIKYLVDALKKAKNKLG
jgi:cysteine desulfurase/selenocysteine lyase